MKSGDLNWFSSPRTSFHSLRRFCRSSSRKNHQQFYPAVAPMSHNNQHGRIPIRVKDNGVHILVATNSSLIGLKACLQKGNYTCTRHLANCTRLVRLWVLEEILLLSLSYINRTPKCPQNTYLYVHRYVYKGILICWAMVVQAFSPST